jgi:hypothetical protein
MWTKPAGFAPDMRALESLELVATSIGRGGVSASPASRQLALFEAWPPARNSRAAGGCQRECVICTPRSPGSATFAAPPRLNSTAMAAGAETACWFQGHWTAGIVAVRFTTPPPMRV